jgi:hypothetical protein
MGDETLPRNCGALNGPPAFEPGKWNDAISLFNNCYNYACNIVTGRFAWPGHWKGPDGHKWLEQDLKKLTCDFAVEGCQLDGLLWFPADQGVDVGCADTCHLIALFTREERTDASGNVTQSGGFHFARKDDDGTWSEKPGSLRPRKMKKNGQEVTDPRDAMSAEWKFCGVFCVCRCEVNIEKEGDQLRWEDAHPGQ